MVFAFWPLPSTRIVMEYVTAGGIGSVFEAQRLVVPGNLRN